MPYSSVEGKDWLVAQVWSALRSAPLRHNAETGGVLAPSVLDIGAGSGTYAELLKRTDPGNIGAVHAIAVEIHAPYVPRFNLRAKYDEVIVGDARELVLPAADVVILGDVLEHMSFGDARRLWHKVRNIATTAVFLSLPIVEWPQGPLDGNEHEAHLHSWTHASVLAHLPGIVEFSRGESIGVYRAYPSIPGVRS